MKINCANIVKIITYDMKTKKFSIITHQRANEAFQYRIIKTKIEDNKQNDM